MSVFRNIKSFDNHTTPKKFLKQAHPNVTVYPWKPQGSMFSLTQPTERGSFFVRRPDAVSGTGDQTQQEKEKFDLKIPPTVSTASPSSGGGSIGGGGGGGGGTGGGGHGMLK